MTLDTHTEIGNTTPDAIANSAEGKAAGLSTAIETRDTTPIASNQKLFTLFSNVNNTSSNDFKPWTDLQKMVKKPVSVPKINAPCIAPHLSGVKTKDGVMANNTMTMLWGDIDTRNLSLEEIKQLLATIGILNYILYSTATSMRLNKTGDAVNGRKWRVLILLLVPISCERWLLIQEALVILLHGDSSAMRIQQILFAPNNPAVTDKRETQHYEYHIEEGELLDVFNLPKPIEEELEKICIKNTPVKKPAKVQSKPLAPADKERIKSALEHISPDSEYYEWLDIGMALHHGFGGSIEGLEIFTAWSRKANTKGLFSEEECEKKWDSFNDRSSGNITLGTLFYQAEQAGWDGTIDNVETPTMLVGSVTDMSWTDAFTVSNEEMEEISDPEWMFENLIIKGHLIVIPAPPNGGKTTIAMWICGQVSKEIKVFYVNADVSGTDAKQYHEQAGKYGITLMLPDMKVGLSMEHVVQKLNEMNNSNIDYRNTLFVFDTLKKMTDVINKSQAKQLYKTLRGLSSKGMTIVLLGHTNKYTDKDGELIFEGTGDLRADVDEMIYLIPQKHDDGSMTVSTRPDKVRGTFEPITFEISPTREVSLTDYIDVEAQIIRDKKLEEDSHIIEAINNAIDKGKTIQSDIIKYCKEHHSLNIKPVKRVLTLFSKGSYRLWDTAAGGANNSITYSKVEKKGVNYDFLYD